MAASMSLTRGEIQMGNTLGRLSFVVGVMSAMASAYSAPLNGTLKKIHDAGEINLGYRESSLPFSYLDDQQQPIGYSMDLCTGIVDAVKAELGLPNLKVKLTPVTSATRIPLIANGTIDMECGSTVNNLERQKQVNFSVTTFIVGTKYVAKKAAKLSTLDDLRGKTVVCTAGTNTMARVHELNQQHKLGMTIIAGKDHAESMLLVETGRAAAFFEDDILLAGLIANARTPADYAFGSESYSVDPYAIMIRRSDRDFKRVVDKSITDMFRNGKVETLYEKWFLNPIPPKNINLKFPEGPAFKKLMANPTDSPDPAAYAAAPAAQNESGKK
jgi:glutamate/aspartate transport system substrate-binding protein